VDTPDPTADITLPLKKDRFMEKIDLNRLHLSSSTLKLKQSEKQNRGTKGLHKRNVKIVD